jgi:uncharacterized Fe-S cluster protein YjdI
VNRKIRSYESGELVVHYDVKRCIHAEECVHGLPSVFDPVRRPWIDPEAADAASVVELVERCGMNGNRAADRRKRRCRR